MYMHYYYTLFLVCMLSVWCMHIAYIILYNHYFLVCMSSLTPTNISRSSRVAVEENDTGFLNHHIVDASMSMLADFMKYIK